MEYLGFSVATNLWTPSKVAKNLRPPSKVVKNLQKYPHTHTHTHTQSVLMKPPYVQYNFVRGESVTYVGGGFFFGFSAVKILWTPYKSHNASTDPPSKVVKNMYIPLKVVTNLRTIYVSLGRRYAGVEYFTFDPFKRPEESGDPI